MIPILRMSRDIAKWLGATPIRTTPDGAFDRLNPATEVFVWTREGDRLVLPKLILWA